MIWRIVPYTGEFNFPFKYQQERVHRISLIVGIEVGKKWNIVFDHLLTLFYVFLCACIKCSHNSQQMTVLTDSGEHHQYHQYHQYHMFNLTSDWAWAASLCWSLHINEQIIKRSAEQPACHQVSRDFPAFEISSKASADNCHDSQNIKQICTPWPGYKHWSVHWLWRAWPGLGLETLSACLLGGSVDRTVCTDTGQMLQANTRSCSSHKYKTQPGFLQPN